MDKYGKLFADELTEWLLEAGFIQSQCMMSIYQKYVPDGTTIVYLSYVYDFVYWYTYEDIGKLFVDLLGKIFHANLLAYEHLLMLIRMMQMRDHSISVDQARYATSIVAKYLNKILLWLSIWILPQLRQAQRMFKANFHMIQYSSNLMHLVVMSKLRS